MDEPMELLARAVLLRGPDVAHDLKTPLNILVLNVELLRMRLRNLSDEVSRDPKIEEHCRALERETYRFSAMADAFLAVARMPEGEPEPVDAATVFMDALRGQSFASESSPSPCRITTYPSRLDQSARLASSGIAAVMDPREATVLCSVEKGRLRVLIEGPCREGMKEFGKLFKFYYTDPSGELNLSLASARLLLETMGGTIVAETDGGISRFHIELQGDE